MEKKLARLAVIAMLGGIATASQAATMTLTGWTYGNGNSVLTSSPAYQGSAGGFSGTLSGAGPDFDGSIETYCVELTQSFGFKHAYSNYELVAASTYFGADKTSTLGRLLTLANPLIKAAAAGDKDDWSTSLQLAIWNTVNDTDDTLTGVSGFNDGSAFAAKANEFLSGAKNQQNQLDLWVLKSDRNQDQLIWLERAQGQEVPEPASLALVAAALGGLSISARRRKSRPA